MGKDEDNLCRQALIEIEGQKPATGKIRRAVWKGEIRRGVWRENDNDIRKLLEGKGNTSSACRNNMQCRRCTTGADEAQEHLKVCESTKE